MKMKRNKRVRMPGMVICGISLALGLSAAGQDADPFAGGGGAEASGDGRQARDPFGNGDADPFDPFSAHYQSRIFRKGRASEVLKAMNEQVAVMIEIIEVDHLTANELLLKYSKKANDVGALREELIGLVRKGEANLQETLWGRAPFDEVGKVESVVEKIYPTEYEPPKLPQVVAEGDAAKKEGSAERVPEENGNVYTSATPSAFDTRNTGTTLEFEVAESPDQPGKVGISIFLEVCKFLQFDTFLAEGHEEDARGTANIVMPRFSTSTHEFAATVTPGNHSLLGIFKDGGDESASKRMVVLMYLDMISKE